METTVVVEVVVGTDSMSDYETLLYERSLAYAKLDGYFQRLGICVGLHPPCATHKCSLTQLFPTSVKQGSAIVQPRATPPELSSALFTNTGAQVFHSASALSFGFLHLHYMKKWKKNPTRPENHRVLGGVSVRTTDL